MIESVPRSRFVRVVLAFLLTLVFIVLSDVPKVAAQEATGHRYLGWLAGGILPTLLGVWLAPKVDVSRGYALTLLGMGFNQAIFCVPILVMVVWRVTNLPHRDWEPFPGEPTPPPTPPEPPAAPSRAPWSRDVTDGY